MTKNKRPELDLDAEAQAALDEARDMPQTQENLGGWSIASGVKNLITESCEQVAEMHSMLAEYHRKLAKEARLDIVRDYHVDLAQRFADEATQIPRRAATLARFHEREKQVTWALARADLREAR